jgi:hypothetical protein
VVTTAGVVAAAVPLGVVDVAGDADGASTLYGIPT